MGSESHWSAESCLGEATPREFAGEQGTIAALDWGGDRPLALLHHANGFCKGVWGLVAAGLKAHYRVVAMDGRGHGDSAPARSPEGYAWAGFANDVGRVARALLDETGASRVALGLGHSFGGTCLLGASALHGDLFDRLVLVDPVIPIRPAEGPAAGAHVVGLVDRARKRRGEWGSRAEAREWFGEKELFAQWDERALDLYVLDGLRDRPDGGVELKCAGDVEAEVFARGGEVDVAAWARRVAVPTRFLWATSGNFPRARYERVVDSMPHARIEDVAAGHLVPMERPACVIQAVLHGENQAV
ncbi:MAG: alpha/beta hydrolase [Myxococcales bacterium]|nr:alpha/beta hydrolase [Myxococcales bacterium]